MIGNCDLNGALLLDSFHPTIGIVVNSSISIYPTYTYPPSLSQWDELKKAASFFEETSIFQSPGYQPGVFLLVDIADGLDIDMLFAGLSGVSVSVDCSHEGIQEWNSSRQESGVLRSDVFQMK